MICTKKQIYQRSLNLEYIHLNIVLVSNDVFLLKELLGKVKFSMELLEALPRTQSWFSWTIRAMPHWFYWMAWWCSDFHGIANMTSFVRMCFLCCISCVWNLSWKMSSSEVQQVVSRNPWIWLQVWCFWN